MSGKEKVRRTGGEKSLRDNLAGSDIDSGIDVIRDDSGSCDRNERRRGLFVDQNAREGNEDEWMQDSKPRSRTDCTTSTRSSHRTTSTSSSARPSGRSRRTRVADIDDYD